MKIGVLCGVGAGKAAKMAELCQMLSRSYRAHAVLGVGGFGGQWLENAQILPEPAPGPYPRRIGDAARALARRGARLFVLLGGDGLAAYAADGLITGGYGDIRLFCVAMGTANVGPIITHNALERGFPDPEALAVRRVGAIQALDGGAHVAYAFNDLVVGDTLLATVEGRTVTVDGALLAREGLLREKEPAARIGQNVKIVKNGRESQSGLGGIAQIVVSAVEGDGFYGRAVAGMLCATPGSQNRGALLLAERPVVTLSAGDGYGYDRPARFEQLLFGPDDELALLGIDPRALLIVDGNPYLRRREAVGVRYCPGAAAVAREEDADADR